MKPVSKEEFLAILERQMKRAALTLAVTRSGDDGRRHTG
jgi:hypothetical protein